MIKLPSYIHFVQPGLMTSVQDLGRFGLAEYGIPYSGAMDRYAVAQVNFILRNPKDAAVLEMSGIGPEMVFEHETRIVFAGADTEVYLNQKPVKYGQIVDIKPDDHVLVKKIKKGQWAYMGIQGGFETETVAESKSWFEGITPRTRVHKGETICYLSEAERYYHPVETKAKIRSDWFRISKIKVYPGPEWDLLPQLLHNRILNKAFRISDMIDRMAYQLEEKISHELDPILTSPVYPGTVQLTPSGKLIVLMRDGQVTGGYPRILQVENASLNVLSQKTPKEKITFTLIS
ncbi:MAG: biotin-dependent carboxyltransferase [Mongoliibacter sp.]|uniref:5-oxoprolinase subunit C family protein n=1 Tax=Mongoliibacter sp. TaxID=2022438 RepID=UPI0012EFE6E4|nr:biotin-dependent carboxyltransferase family protein [Mongoliibacter sp.]TVP51692.1 MAG: biotin-dependent carboxyltransferase [Mongoliibacter sp.]